MWVKMDDVEGRERTEGTLFTLSKVKAHQTKKAVEALQGDELTAFSANSAVDLAAKQGVALCSTEMERER